MALTRTATQHQLRPIPSRVDAYWEGIGRDLVRLVPDGRGLTPPIAEAYFDGHLWTLYWYGFGTTSRAVEVGNYPNRAEARRRADELLASAVISI